MLQVIEGGEGGLAVSPDAPQELVRDLNDELIRLIDNETDSVDVRSQATELAGRMLGLIFRWVVRVDPTAKESRRQIGDRALSAIWVCNPWIFEQRESLRQLAAMFGLSAAQLSPLTAEFSRLHKISNEFQKHDSQPGRKQAHPISPPPTEEGRELDLEPDETEMEEQDGEDWSRN